MRTVVIGGYGNFGARICHALSADPDIQVIAAGRAPGAIGPHQKIQAVKLDLLSSNFAADLKKLSPDIVIHCAGPFQGQDYRVAKAAVAAGAHYIDLADGRAFVNGFAQEIDSLARDSGLLMISGASTVPALSSAVVDELITRFRQIDEIQTYIAPGQRAPRGTATIAGVFSYAGKPFKWMRDGQWRNASGWQELVRVDFSGLGVRWAAACDIPDLDLFPARYPGVRTVEFRAALELGIQHLALWSAAALRRSGMPLPIERAAPLLNRVASLLDCFGSERGGMLVSLAGISSDGSKMRIDWHLTADANHGPEIPCMAAILLARKLARGQVAASGAFVCMGFLKLAEFEAEFARWRISVAIKEGPA
ncbi:MAG: saccharopine dehydrogenase NADP-binding domain-containing protein [Betaproteobacteria bacterium]|nr:saccharopine dehydrogenase NADP-binding domain-containing protein [Betaproteobacteria bacterium]